MVDKSLDVSSILVPEKNHLVVPKGGRKTGFSCIAVPEKALPICQYLKVVEKTGFPCSSPLLADVSSATSPSSPDRCVIYWSWKQPCT